VCSFLLFLIHSNSHVPELMVNKPTLNCLCAVSISALMHVSKTERQLGGRGGAGRFVAQLYSFLPEPFPW
jgi:hypothetical protein